MGIKRMVKKFDSMPCRHILRKDPYVTYHSQAIISDTNRYSRFVISFSNGQVNMPYTTCIALRT